MALVKSYVTS